MAVDYGDDRDMWVRNPYTQKLLKELGDKKEQLIANWIQGKYVTTEDNMAALMSVQILLEVELYISSPEYADFREPQDEN